MQCSSKHGRLQADQIARKQKVQNLSAAVRKRLKPKRPRGIQCVDFRILIAGTNNLGAGRQRDVVAFDRGDRAEFVGADRLEQAARAQFAFEAAHLHAVRFPEIYVF